MILDQVKNDTLLACHSRGGGNLQRKMILNQVENDKIGG